MKEIKIIIYQTILKKIISTASLFTIRIKLVDILKIRKRNFITT